MNKPLDISELQSSATILDRFFGKVEVMDRNAKLRHWASLVRAYSLDSLRLEHSLEHWSYLMLCETKVIDRGSALSVAVKDPTFNKMGLSQDASVMDLMKFMELSHNELHEFSCDCGGWMDNQQQADRILRLTRWLRLQRTSG